MKLIAALGLAAACLAAPVHADEFTAAQKQELGAFIEDYLVNNPDVLREAIEALDKRDKEVAAAQQKKVVADQAGALFSSKFQATIGNPKGNATLVEFFDYNCHFCKGALPDVTKLMKDDPNLKLVLKDYPVLGPGSVEAAKVASAARNQLPGDKFWPFHAKLLATHGPVGKTEALGGRPRSRPRHGQARQGHGQPRNQDRPRRSHAACRFAANQRHADLRCRAGCRGRRGRL